MSWGNEKSFKPDPEHADDRDGDGRDVAVIVVGWLYDVTHIGWLADYYHRNIAAIAIAVIGVFWIWFE